MLRDSFWDSVLHFAKASVNFKNGKLTRKKEEQYTVQIQMFLLDKNKTFEEIIFLFLLELIE